MKRTSMRTQHVHGTPMDTYIAGFPRTTQAALKRVRSAIRRAVPRAEEVISYGMPAYKLDGGYVLAFAGWKQHYALYGSTDGVVAAFKDPLAAYEVGKGTIRFPLSEPVPVKLIESISKLRAKQVIERAKAKAAALQKR